MATRVQAVTIIRPVDSAWYIAERLRRLAEYADPLGTHSVYRINVRYRQTLLGVTRPLGRTFLYVEPGKSVRGYFYTPHDWRQVVDHAKTGDHSFHV